MSKSLVSKWALKIAVVRDSYKLFRDGDPSFLV